MVAAEMIPLTMPKTSVSYSGKYFALISISPVLKQPMQCLLIIRSLIWMGCGQRSGLMVFVIHGN